MNSLKIDNFIPISFNKSEQITSNGSTEFKDVIKTAIDNVNDLEKDGDKSIVNLLQGKEDVHTTMIALQKADISMRMLLSVRNKALEAYKEIMHMQF
ncbi:MAG: flagellar hook-basal body complex protein FliE [Desulfobacterium sp.]|nr:flagellar hook-basal body complex protein FliE [Desulfobacterium sp.]MBU3950072.1 flagellar hook-basal body complex protein FliE [Pseudomonadota bacterium]MBU4010687.1 flagellar hook-basal body complex protein FliE [Pseudomonadota bacterium]MBU4037765.1 flagellar hook-basal body complex protein FliE [Pseudomonadota bacterium]